MSAQRKRKVARQQRRQGVPGGVIAGGVALTVGAVVAVVLAVVLVTGGGGGQAGPSVSGDSGVFLLRPDDSREAISNGQQLDVGDMTAEVFFSEFPPKVSSSMDVLLKEKASGTPVDDAQVTVLPSMPHPGMTKGSIQIEGAPRQPGHYFASWQLPMKGGWTFDIEVRRGEQSSVLELLAFLS